MGGYDVLVTTPLRLVQVVREGGVDLSQVLTVVLDEADKLFELGKQKRKKREKEEEEEEEKEEDDKSFLGQVDELLAACTHPHIQRALFSATLPPTIEALARTVLRDPISISVGAKNAGNSDIEQRLVFVGREEGKLLAVRQVRPTHPFILLLILASHPPTHPPTHPPPSLHSSSKKASNPQCSSSCRAKTALASSITS